MKLDYRLFSDIRCSNVIYSTDLEKRICPLEQLYVDLKSKHRRFVVWLEANGGMGKTTSTEKLQNKLNGAEGCYLFRLKQLSNDVNGRIQAEYNACLDNISKLSEDSLVILDGYDEICKGDANDTDNRWRFKYAKNCISVAAKKCNLIVTSRPMLFKPEIEGVDIIYAIMASHSDERIEHILGRAWIDIKKNSDYIGLLRNTFYLRLVLSEAERGMDIVSWAKTCGSHIGETDLLMNYCKRMIAREEFQKQYIDGVLRDNGEYFFSKIMQESSGKEFQPFDFGIRSSKIKNFCIAFYITERLIDEYRDANISVEFLSKPFHEGNSEILFFVGELLKKEEFAYIGEKIIKYIHNNTLESIRTEHIEVAFNNVMTILLGYNDRIIKDAENLRYILGAYSKNKFRQAVGTVKYNKHLKISKKLRRQIVDQNFVRSVVRELWNSIDHSSMDQELWESIEYDNFPAFIWEQYIKEIHFPDNDWEIGLYSFVACGNLTNIYTNVSTDEWMRKNKGVLFPNICTIHCSDGDILSIGGITEEKNLCIGDNVKAIDVVKYVRNGLDFNFIQVSNGNKRFSAVNNCLIDNESGVLVLGCGNSVIPKKEKITAIGKNAFKCCSFYHTDMIIPEGVLCIEEGAFEESNITSIVIPASVKKINFLTFECCFALKDIYFGETRYQWKKVHMDDTLNQKHTQIHCHGFISGVQLRKIITDFLIYLLLGAVFFIPLLPIVLVGPDKISAMVGWDAEIGRIRIKWISIALLLIDGILSYCISGKIIKRK